MKSQETTARVLGQDNGAWTGTEPAEVGNTIWRVELEGPADTLNMGPEGDSALFRIWVDGSVTTGNAGDWGPGVQVPGTEEEFSWSSRSYKMVSIQVLK